MAIDFPASPTNGQTFTSGSVTYTWDGTKWTAVAAGGGATDKITEGNTSAEVIDTGSDGRFVVTTEGSERLRVDSSGRLGIGSTAPQGRFESAAGDSTDFAITANNTLSTGGEQNYISLNAGATRMGSITRSVNDIALKAHQASLSFWTGTGGTATQKAAIDSSGRLLVGTSTARGALARLQIERADGEAQAEFISNFGPSFAEAPSYLMLSRTNGSSIGSTSAVANGDALGRVRFRGHDGTDFRAAADITAYVDGTPGANDMPGRLVFSTTADGASSPTERLRITNDGYALFNTTNKALRDSTSDVGLSIDPGAGGLLQLAAGGPTYFNRVSSDGSIIAFRRNGANVGSISVTGSATAYNTSSDYRLKENVTAVTDGIVRLQQLKPSRFNFIADPSTTVDGFIAHEVQTVVPEAIYGEKDEVDSDGNPIYQGIDQSKLVPLLTAALKEAVAKIESLEARLTAAGI